MHVSRYEIYRHIADKLGPEWQANAQAFREWHVRRHEKVEAQFLPPDGLENRLIFKQSKDYPEAFPVKHQFVLPVLSETDLPIMV